MTTIFTATLPSNSTGNEGFSYRCFTPITGPSLGQVRVSFGVIGGGGGNWNCDHAAIAVLGGATAPNVAATPIELLFGGVSGFGLVANQVIVSDWVNLSASISDILCIIHDTNVSAGTIGFNNQVGNSWDMYRKAASASYNQASVSGYSHFADFIFGFSLIETQAGAAPINNIGILGYVDNEW